MTDIEPIEAELVNESAGSTDPIDRREQAEHYVMLWLHGFTNQNTRNAYARAIGLSAEKRRELPGAPAQPGPPDDLAWLPWALEHSVTPYGDLEDVEVESWLHAIAHREKNVRRQAFAALCSFYKSLRRKKLTYCDPNDLIDRGTMGLKGAGVSKTRKLTTHQVRALFTASRLDGSMHQERNRAVVAVLAATGCRSDELTSLDDGDYTRESAAGPAWLLLDGKGDKRRWQKLPAADADLVEQYLAERPEPEVRTELTRLGEVSNRPATERPLFRNRFGRRMDPDNIKPMLRRVANLPQPEDQRQTVRWAEQQLRGVRDKLHPHQFRHTYAVTAVRNGATAKQVQHDLGHASLATTQVYLDGAEEVENSAAQTVSDIFHAGEELTLLEPEGLDHEKGGQ